MKLFGIKDNKSELYFQIEKAKKTLEMIDDIAVILFDDEGDHFENRWQTGLPDKEDYMGFKKGGIYMGVVISVERIHIIIRGLPKKSINKKKIKKMIMRDYKMIEPKGGWNKEKRTNTHKDDDDILTESKVVLFSNKKSVNKLSGK